MYVIIIFKLLVIKKIIKTIFVIINVKDFYLVLIDGCKKYCVEICMDMSDQNKKKGFLSPCKEKVEIILKNCGHKKIVQCRESKNPFLLRNIKCKASCSAKLECGHEFSGKCQDCLDLKENYKLDLHKGYCNKKCETPLPCNHKCKDICSKDNCGPYKSKCETRCLHNFCPKSCGENCPDCKESCKNNCKHYKCNKKCFEICDRPPCNEKYYKKLK